MRYLVYVLDDVTTRKFIRFELWPNATPVEYENPKPGFDELTSMNDNPISDVFAVHECPATGQTFALNSGFYKISRHDDGGFLVKRVDAALIDGQYTVSCILACSTESCIPAENLKLSECVYEASSSGTFYGNPDYWETLESLECVIDEDF